MKNQPVQLGSLEIAQYFKKGDTLYRTIEYPYSKRWSRDSKRWCLNMTTLKSEYLYCREMVFHVPENIELSKRNEN